MTIRKFLNQYPQIAVSAFIDENALVIGDVIIGEDSSIWPTAVVRGDVNSIRIGARTSIQDGSVVHATHAGPYNPQGYSTSVGNEVTVGHRVVLHGCIVHDLCLIGMNSCIMDGAVVESFVILGAGSLVPPGKILEGGYLWLGSPVRRARPLTDQEREQLSYSANYYVGLKNQHIQPIHQ